MLHRVNGQGIWGVRGGPRGVPTGSERGVGGRPGVCHPDTLPVYHRTSRTRTLSGASPSRTGACRPAWQDMSHTPRYGTCAIKGEHLPYLPKTGPTSRSAGTPYLTPYLGRQQRPPAPRTDVQPSSDRTPKRTPEMTCRGTSATRSRTSLRHPNLGSKLGANNDPNSTNFFALFY